jgi:phosphoserine phosphatase RsbU/P
MNSESAPGRPLSATQTPAERALAAAGMGTWEFDAATGALAWDAQACALFGIEPAAFGGTIADFLALVHPDDRGAVGDGVNTAAGGAGYDGEFRILRPGETSPHILRLRLAGDGGRLAGLCWEITQRQHAERLLNSERYLLRTLMDHLPDHIYFKDLDSKLIAVNRAMAAGFGFSEPDQMRGMSDFDLFARDHAQPAFDDEQRIIETGVSLVNLEEREIWPDGHETWASTTKMPLRDGAGRIIGTFGLSRDITKRKAAEEQVAQFTEELRTKNAALQEDLAMARELQTALLPQTNLHLPAHAATGGVSVHVHHIYQPSMAVGGDFFEVVQISENVSGLFICDVMGHGVRAALVAAIVRALVGELKGVGHQPGEFLAQLNAKLSAILKQTEIPMFASAFYVLADLAKGELSYANAGHPDPLCVRHDTAEGHAVPLNHCKRGPVLGMFAEAEYASSAMPVSVRDMVLLFTDGLFEVEGADGVLYDQKSLVRAVNRRANLSPERLCTEVLAEVRDFSAKHEFDDDVCLVAFEVGRLGV